MQPEKIFKFLNSYFKLVAPIIRTHGGIIDKYIGDAILALFENPEKAVQASIAIELKLRKFNHKLLKMGLPKIEIGIGIHTGEIMLGILGESKRMEATVIADSVNLASRLEDLNKTYGSTIIVSDVTHWKVTVEAGKNYHFRFLDVVQVKGKKQSTPVYELFECNSPEEIKKKNSTKIDFEEGVALFHDNNYKEAVNKFLNVIKENPNDRVAVFYLHRTAHFMASSYSLVTLQVNKQFEWTSQYEIGIKGIDEQHKKLFEIVNDLYWATTNSGSRSFIGDVLHRLVVYTLAHFSVEEELMLRFKAPVYEHHKKEHEKFKETVGNFIKEFNEGKSELTYEILDFLNVWLREHTKGSDKIMAPYIKSAEEEILY
jgi:hemerythrin-like metal-binding protein